MRSHKTQVPIRAWHALTGLTILGLFVPQPCFANLGGMLLFKATGFQQAIAFHFVVGNLLLGLIEALVLIRAFRTPAGRSYPLMIAANYISAAAYFPVAALLGTPFTDGHLMQALLVALVVTLLIEAPFVFWCFPRDRRQPRRWLTANVFAQAISYVLLVVFYLAQPLLFSDMELRTPSSMSSGPFMMDRGRTCTIGAPRLTPKRPSRGSHASTTRGPHPFLHLAAKRPNRAISNHKVRNVGKRDQPAFRVSSRKADSRFHTISCVFSICEQILSRN